MSPTMTATRPSRNFDSCSTAKSNYTVLAVTTGYSFLSARFNLNLVEHVLPAQGLGYALRLVLGEWMLCVRAGNFEHTFIEHDHAERAKGYPWRNLYFIHVVDSKVSRLFDPVLNEWVSEGMFGFNFREVGPLND
jgi:hypothetical protein